jgi:hypothetical protein
VNTSAIRVNCSSGNKRRDNTVNMWIRIPR